MKQIATKIKSDIRILGVAPLEFWPEIVVPEGLVLVLVLVTVPDDDPDEFDTSGTEAAIALTVDQDATALVVTLPCWYGR
jgi:hypothetical protein